MVLAFVQGFAQQYLQAYHVFNLLAILWFPLCRMIPGLRALVFPKHKSVFTHDDLKVLLMLGIWLSLKARRIGSIDQFISHAFLACKLALFMILFQDGAVALNIAFCVVCGVLFLLFPAPAVATKHPIVTVNSGRLDNFLCKKSADKPIYTVLKLYTTWAHTCTLLARDYAAVANHYANANLVFLKSDIGLHEDLAKRFEIDVSAKSIQLPTFILFRNGEEVARLPGKGHSLLKRPRLSADILAQSLRLAELNRLKDAFRPTKPKSS
eukprot:m.167135 g.167135  ORF g.167135 m.167135 type:complete len:267 (+) comp14452_c0_seq1:97-897(+)